MFYFACCINIILNSLLVQLVKYDVHTTRKTKFIHAIVLSHYYTRVCYFLPYGLQQRAVSQPSTLHPSIHTPVEHAHCPQGNLTPVHR